VLGIAVGMEPAVGGQVLNDGLLEMNFPVQVHAPSPLNRKMLPPSEFRIENIHVGAVAENTIALALGQFRHDGRK
jgi:hypothetical protein